MCFWIYNRSETTCQRVTSLKLAGREGPLAGFLTEDRSAGSPYHWKLRGPEIIQRSSPHLPSEHHLLVLDMMPNESTSVCLYEIQVIQGFSEYDETDLVLGCKVLYERRGIPNSDTAKSRFETVGGSKKDGLIFEPLRLTGGTREGQYRWARPKMDIGATIF